MKVKKRLKANVAGFRIDEEITAVLNELALVHDIHTDLFLYAVINCVHLKLNGSFREHPLAAFEDTPFLEFVQLIKENEEILEKIQWIFSWDKNQKSVYIQLENAPLSYEIEFIPRYPRCVSMILFQIREYPRKKLSDFDIVSDEERRWLLYDLNSTSVLYPWNKTVCKLFEEQEEKRPNNTAVIKVLCHVPFDQVYLTYSELNKKANRLARLLHSLGVQRGTPVGIMMDRSLEMTTALWAILKAGGTYLPLDPDYPVETILAMMDQANADFLLTQTAILKEKSFKALLARKECILLDRLEKQAGRVSLENLEKISGSEDLIYINFTFDSSGKFYSAGIYHHNFMNLMCWFIKEFNLTSADRNLLITPLHLNITQKNLCAPLLTGAALCLPAFNFFEPAALIREARENLVTWINCTPSMFYQLVEYEIAAGKKKLSFLKYVFLGDEEVSLVRLSGWLGSGDYQARIVNTYGPGECADVCSFYPIPHEARLPEEPVPIGRPIYNVELYVLDKKLKPVPVGVPGELYIGGEGVGLGYINDKEYTHRKFIRHTFEEGKQPCLLYRTYDIVKWLPDGCIQFLKHADN